MAFTIADRILENEQDAEEIVQDAFLQVYRSIKNFRKEAKFSTWLYRIVVNKALNQLKKRKIVRKYKDVELAEVQAEAVENGYKSLSSQDQTKYIQLAIVRLNPEDRLLLTLYYLDEQSLAEIGSITGISKENVKMKLHRARKKMYGILSGLMDNE